jgi:hypothetical protein
MYNILSYCEVTDQWVQLGYDYAPYVFYLLIAIVIAGVIKHCVSAWMRRN